MLLNAFIQPIAISILIIGLASCFFGYEINRTFIRVTGLLIGAAIGLILPILFQGDIEVSLILALFFGILGAIFSIPFHVLFIFLEGGINGAFVTVGVLVLLTRAWTESMGIAVLVFVLCGILAVVFKIGFTILSTAITGATGIVLGVVFLSPDLMTSQPAILFFSGIVLISAMGVVFQYNRWIRRKENRSVPVPLPNRYVPLPYTYSVNPDGGDNFSDRQPQPLVGEVKNFLQHVGLFFHR
jgi:hypothetical protein